MGKLGFNLSSPTKKQIIERNNVEDNSVDYPIGDNSCYCDTVVSTVVGSLDEYDDGLDDEEIMLSLDEQQQQQQQQHQQRYFKHKQQHQQNLEPSKKIYVLYLTATTVIVCFLFFTIIPELLNYSTETNALQLENNVYSSQQSVVEFPDARRSARNQERLDIMRRFNALQKKYNELQIEYKKAEEEYLKKLHNAVAEENIGSQYRDVKTVNGLAKPNELEIYKLEDLKNINKDKDEKTEKDEKIIVS